MSATSQATSSGVVFGIVVVFLLQQFGYLALSDLLTSIFYFAVAAIVAGVVCGLAARAAGRKPSTPS